MPDRVFVAYSGHDAAFAHEIMPHLEAKGFDVASDHGREADATGDIANGIRRCDAFLLIAGDAVTSAAPGRRRAELAFALEKPVLVVWLVRQNVPWLARAASVSGRNLAHLVRKLSTLIKESRTTNMIDITDREELIRYVVRVQLYRVAATPARVAGIGIDEAELAAFLDGTGSISLAALGALDDAVLAIGHAGGRTQIGGLAQFAVRLRDVALESAGHTRVPPDWTAETLRADSDDEIHVLVQASTLVNEFAAADRVGVPSETIRARHQEAIRQVVDRLILLASGLQSARHLEAQLLLAGLARYVFDTVRTRLLVSIHRSPLGFRSWRSVTRLVMIARAMDPNHPMTATLVDNLKAFLLQLALESGDLRWTSIYPGRSLDLELFIAIPWDWGISDSTDLVTQAMVDRAEDDRVTLRERGTAAMGLWQRAYENGRADDADIQARLRHLIDRFRDDKSDIAEGLRWVAATLEAAMTENVPVLTTLPAVSEPWRDAVEAAARALGGGMPDQIIRPTRELFRHALLQNAGVERRRAIDALAAGGLVDPVAHQLLRLLDDHRVGAWLRVRALFALGFMQARTDEAQDELVRACERAARTVMHGNPDRAEITELQEALFAVADVFGVTGVEDSSVITRAGQIRGRLSDMLEELTEYELTKGSGRRAIARALTYLLLFTAQPGRSDLSRTLLERLRNHQDEVTQEFCAWILRFRWGHDDGLRPLLRGVS